MEFKLKLKKSITSLLEEIEGEQETEGVVYSPELQLGKVLTGIIDLTPDYESDEEMDYGFQKRFRFQQELPYTVISVHGILTGISI